ncbi:hypothetical protein, partial [Actinomyces sp. Z5]|uniref:hypothetical protein n=1 Tax=Actinomyces sp. Z5 TaxID=2250216 RepID=UPI001C6581D5
DTRAHSGWPSHRHSFTGDHKQGNGWLGGCNLNGDERLNLLPLDRLARCGCACCGAENGDAPSSPPPTANAGVTNGGVNAHALTLLLRRGATCWSVWIRLRSL